MRTIDLKDLTPKGAKFTLAATDKEYRLRPVNLEDELWLAETFGTSIQMVFMQRRMADICKIIFHQLEDEAKKEFLAQEVTIIDGDGVQHKVKIGGYKLLYRLIQGNEEKELMLRALFETIGLSRDIQDELEKREQEAEKKSLNQQIGQSSLTEFRPPTDGPPIISGQEPLEKSIGDSGQ